MPLYLVQRHALFRFHFEKKPELFPSCNACLAQTPAQKVLCKHTSPLLLHKTLALRTESELLVSPNARRAAFFSSLLWALSPTLHALTFWDILYFMKFKLPFNPDKSDLSFGSQLKCHSCRKSFLSHRTTLASAFTRFLLMTLVHLNVFFTKHSVAYDLCSLPDHLFLVKKGPCPRPVVSLPSVSYGAGPVVGYLKYVLIAL